MKGVIMPNSKVKTESSRSWFCVLNNPAAVFGEEHTPEEMVDMAIEMWCRDKPQRTCAVNYEIGDTGNHHMHMVLEDPAKSRFSALQKLFPGIHIEPTRGSKEQAEDYINKRGRFAEKEHTVVVPAVKHGEIKASKGARNDLQIIEQLIESGNTPNEIMRLSLPYRKYESLIKKAYFDKRIHETPLQREITAYWHVGESGSGKSYTYIQLAERYSENDVYMLTDYENGGFDNYEGQRILFMDEFKGSMKFQTLLNLLDCYRIQIHCRYADAYALWTEVHITSIFPPEEAYNFMVDSENRERDRISQLIRRLSKIVYHYKQGDDYMTYEMDADVYINYDDLIAQAVGQDGFIPMESEPKVPLPFD
jgi:hypothetical protein